MTHGPAARLAGCAPGMRRHPAGVVYWTRLEGAAREPKARLLHSMEAVATASMSLSGATTASAPVSALSLPRLQEALPQAPGVCPGDGCRCPPPEMSLALGKRVVGPLPAAVRGVGRVPATATRWRVRGTSIRLDLRRFASAQARSPTCRCPRCLRRDWQSDASTSRSRRRGFPGRSTTGWRRTGRALADPASRDPDKGRTRREAWALSRSHGTPQCYGRSRARERIRVAGRRGSPGLSSGGVGNVRISFVLTFWSSRPLWASHSRFGALSLTF